MGIDASIVLRLKQKAKPTEAWLLETSFKLCSSIGAKHFFIKDGLPSAEFEPLCKKWMAAFQAHPRYKDLDEWGAKHDSAYAEIERDIGKVPQERRMAIDFTKDYRDEGDAPREDGKVYCQDGPDVLAEPDEWLLRVSVWTRYYGPDYERGDLLTLCAIAEWCELNIPNCEVWYGGDSSGVLLGRFGNPERVMLRRHLYSALGRAYFRYGARDGITPPRCSLCPPSEQSPWQQFGSGENYVACHCAGCGKSKETRDGGITWTERKDD